VQDRLLIVVVRSLRGHWSIALLLAHNVESGGTDDDGNSSGRSLHFEHLEHLQSRLFVTKDQVQDNQIGVDVFDFCDVLHREASQDHLIALFFFQKNTEQFEDFLRVVHHENASCHGVSPFQEASHAGMIPYVWSGVKRTDRSCMLPLLSAV